MFRSELARVRSGVADRSYKQRTGIVLPVSWSDAGIVAGKVEPLGSQRVPGRVGRPIADLNRQCSGLDCPGGRREGLLEHGLDDRSVGELHRRAAGCHPGGGIIFSNVITANIGIIQVQGQGSQL